MTQRQKFLPHFQQKVWPLKNVANDTQTPPQNFVSWVIVWAFSAQSPVWMPQKDLHVTPNVSYFSFKINVST